jgi:hypothetical protein
MTVRRSAQASDAGKHSADAGTSLPHFAAHWALFLDVDGT